ncbi:hypothetical protein ACFOWB_08525 [Chenggangzhangella methanolivorans]|uniref:hypothetical protein n=1 Tax=Chenggangzhangella methanolivorans TaxID=1437009 RepID=UPI0036061A09
MTPPQLFAWRRTYRAEAEKAASFVPVVVTAEPEVSARPRPRRLRRSSLKTASIGREVDGAAVRTQVP